MTDVRRLNRALIARVLGSHGTAPVELRRSAFDADIEADRLGKALCLLIDRVAHHSDQVTDEDIAAVLATGFTEDQIFELVVCAAIGQANRQYDSALAALAEATGETGPIDEA